MAGRKMLILRGNSAAAGSYPDEQGDTISWPDGALHVDAAKAYAKRRNYQPDVLNVPGQPQSRTSPQANELVKRFLDDKDGSDTAFYGFSGGGYNMYWILLRLAEENPESLDRIKLVVVLGAPNTAEDAYKPPEFNKIAKESAKKAGLTDWKPGDWELVYRKDPDKSVMPNMRIKKLNSHMWGPEALLYEGTNESHLLVGACARAFRATRAPLKAARSHAGSLTPDVALRAHPGYRLLTPRRARRADPRPRRRDARARPRSAPARR